MMSSEEEFPRGANLAGALSKRTGANRTNWVFWVVAGFCSMLLRLIYIPVECRTARATLHVKVERAILRTTEIRTGGSTVHAQVERTVLPQALR